MKFLLTTTTGIAALVAGAGIAMAQDQSAASTSSSMGADATCADIANLGEDQAERALYFLAGLHHGQGSSGSSGMSGDSAAAMPSTDSGSSGSDASSSSAASTTATDGGAPSTDSASTTTPGSQAPGSSGMAESPSSPLPADSSAAATGATPDSAAGAGSSTDTAASNVPSGGQSDGASQDTAGAVPGIESEDGDDSMQDLAEADSGIDQTTTAGVSGTASGTFTADGFYDIPVDMVMADCRTSPDASISEVLGKHNSK